MAAEPLNVADVCADDLDRLIHSTLREQVGASRPSPRAWARIAHRIERESANRSVGRATTPLTPPEPTWNVVSDAWNGGLLSYWIRWTQLSHQVR